MQNKQKRSKFKFKSQNQVIDINSNKQVQIFFKYKLASLIRGCNKNPYYDIENKKKQINVLKRKVLAHNFNKKELDSQEAFNHCRKITIVKSKYRFRQKPQWKKQMCLKSIHCKLNQLDDFKQLQNRQKDKTFQQQYLDLNDSYQDSKQQEKKDFYPNSLFNSNTILYYKKNNKIQDKLIYIINGGYVQLANYLNQNGWVQNKDKNSLIYNLKFVTKRKEIDFVNIIDSQIVNHFQKNNVLTTKYGLCRNIKNILIYEGINFHQYYPRCYDLYDSSQLEDFIQQFKLCYCQSILKKHINGTKSCNNIEMILKILQRKIMSLNDKIYNILEQNFPLINQKEWIQILQSNKKQNKLVNLQQCIKLQKFLKINDNQYNINYENIWIVKPASKSRGRGIKTFNSLTKLLDYVIGKDQQWVVQKYIQNPLIIRNKKFDIRQWVMITDFKPLRIWLFQQYYIRLTSQEYNPNDLSNRFIHITNHQIQKSRPQYLHQKQSYMCSMAQFHKILINQYSKSNQQIDSIIKQIKKIVVQTIKSVDDMIKPRDNTFQLIGYDFIVDESMNLWLLQINSSPTMQTPTQIIQQLVKRALEGIGELINSYYLQHKHNIRSYNGWNLIHNF